MRHAKLARLLVETRRVSQEQYRIDLSGPASILNETRRYGISFARFVAGLVACGGWAMRAVVGTPWGGTASMRVNSEDGYRSYLDAPAAFDSELESALMTKWGVERNGWRLSRDAGILQDGQTTFVPDFLMQHTDGREAFVEIVGFWTPEYLQSKRETIRRFRNRRIVLAIPKQSMRVDAAPGVVVYATRIRPEALVTAVEELFSAGA